MSIPSKKRLIVTADDFGRSASINAAVVQAHRDGILTSASLMVNGGAFDEAVQLAHAHPNLAVGLHLTLCCGHSTLGPAFSDSPVAAGLQYFFSSSARLQDEISAQLDKFSRTGLRLDHVNGHLHFHLHPTVLRLLVKHPIPALRLTHDPLLVDWPLSRGRWLYRLTHALIFSLLSRHAKPRLLRARIPHTARVFGLLENGRISEDYILKLLRVLPPGDSELYSHPSLHDFKHEFDALISPRVRRAVVEQGIQLIRYQDL